MATSLNNIIKLANTYVNADLTNMEGFTKHLVAWYCFKFNVSMKDPVLLSHTKEELALLYFMFQIKETPEKFSKVLGDKEVDDYEEWLKKYMGENYVTNEEMVEEMVNYAKLEQELAAKLPDKITTDFAEVEAQDERSNQ